MITRPKLKLVGWAGLLAALSFGLAACCGNISCDVCLPYASDVALSFDTDSLQAGFRKAELKSAYLVRYAQPGFATVLDTVRLNRDDVPYRSVFSLYELAEQGRSGSQASAGPITDYNYRFVLPAPGRTYNLSDLQVKTRVEGGCCACAENVRRRFVLNGQPVVADGSGAGATTILRR
ncbi:hypothetical protein [uncultured Hymenobacter sp.]|uniref:hypothetical protein n=1 Tax=uncultured Hymenobacter sp. TaxID=170016 RepID=UPI0035CA2AE3